MSVRANFNTQNLNPLYFAYIICTKLTDRNIMGVKGFTVYSFNLTDLAEQIEAFFLHYFELLL